MKNLIIYFISFLLIAGCGKGIEPEPEAEEGFGGTIYFTGEWPDSITRTHLVVFKNQLLSPGDFNALNLAYVSLEIPFGTTEYRYSSLDSALFPINAKIQAGTFSYIAVAQQKTPVLTLNRGDWYVTGVYYAEEDSSVPGKMVIKKDQFTDNVNILCDFNNPPPQPPGGINE